MSARTSSNDSENTRSRSGSTQPGIIHVSRENREGTPATASLILPFASVARNRGLLLFREVLEIVILRHRLAVLVEAGWLRLAAVSFRMRIASRHDKSPPWVVCALFAILPPPHRNVASGVNSRLAQEYRINLFLIIVLQ